MFSACLPPCILYLMHLFCIGFLLLNRLYVLVFEACRDWKMTSFLTLRPALKASSAWTVNIHQVYINLSLFLHPRSSNFRLFVLMIVQRGAILTGRKTNPFYFESFQYLVSFAKSNDHNPMYFWNSHVFPLKLGACSVLNNLCSCPFISLKRKKKNYIKHHLMSELSILHLLACISASQKGILSSSSLCVCVVGGCAEVTALIV